MRKVLIVRVGAMGDVLHALPAVAALRREHPEWRIDWAVDTRWAPLLIGGDERGPVVDMVHLVPTREWSRAKFSPATFQSIRALRTELLTEHYDLVVDMQGTLRSAVIGRMAQAEEEFAGYRYPREAAAKWLYGRALERRGAHVVEQGADLLGKVCGVALTPGAVELPHEDWADHWAEEVVGSGRLCVLAAGGGWGAKRWPVEKYGALARELRKMGFDVVVNAPRKDDAMAESVVAASEGAARVVVCNVMGLVALLRRTSLLVGGDSGPTHLAATLGVPLVALFGPTDPARNGPWGPGECRVLRDAASTTSYKKAAETERGLARMTVESVVTAVRELMAAQQGIAR